MNSLKDLIQFFGTVDRPVTPTEFREFWNSLVESEKDYYKNAPLV